MSQGRAASQPASDPSAPLTDPELDLHGRRHVTVGRDADNDLSLQDLRVSRHHARLERQSDESFEVVDLDSANGTFVNGRRVKKHRVDVGDYIGVGGQVLRVDEERLRVVTARHTAWFGAVDLVVQVGETRILDEVGFALPPSSVLAVVGPSGCGKSTLLNALTGVRPADGGHVVFDGRDVYAAYDDLRSRMGLVPQADILHTQLSVRQALEYAAELRFPRDVRPDARAKRVQEVMEELHIANRANTRIDRLSGGQRKRVSVGCELLTEPTLLFLDEPTSGLDPGNEAALMESLRDLARHGRTVVVVTHSLQSLELADRLLVLAPGGRLAYYGPPDGALPYFEPFGGGSSYAMMFRTLEEDQAADWKARFRAAPQYEELVREPLASADLAGLPTRPNLDPPPAPTPSFHQLGVLIRRYVAVIRADRGFALALAIQAPLFGLLFALVIAADTMNTAQSLNASVLIWLLIVGATWLGTSNAIREVVKELPIYHRERAIGLSVGAYVSSKVFVLGVITILQTAVMVPIAMSLQTLPAVNSIAIPNAAEIPSPVLARLGIDPALANLDIHQTGLTGMPQLPELILVAIVAGIAAMALGLFVSSIIGGIDRAATLLPIILVAQVLVSAPLINDPGWFQRGASLVLSASWGMAAAASTIDLELVREPFVALTQKAAQEDVNLSPQPFWRRDLKTWLTDMGALATLTVMFLGGTWFALKSQDPNLLEGRHKGRRKAPRAAPAPI